jgi:hypothetical protein
VLVLKRVLLHFDDWIGSRCRICNPLGKSQIPEDVAVDVMRAAGYVPLEQYPGSGMPWRCRCSSCGQERTPMYVSAKKDHGCANCRNDRIPEDVAVDVMRAAGYVPLEQYPGSGNPWCCRCTTCGQERTPRYTAVKMGNRCGNCHRGRPTNKSSKALTDSGSDT